MFQFNNKHELNLYNVNFFKKLRKCDVPLTIFKKVLSWIKEDLAIYIFIIPNHLAKAQHILADFQRQWIAVLKPEIA